MGGNTVTSKPKLALRKWHFKVLLAILDLSQDGLPITMGRIQKHLGYAGRTGPQEAVLALVKGGWIKKDYNKVGTIRPNVKMFRIRREDP